jgi:hypothetical protein
MVELLRRMAREDGAVELDDGARVRLAEVGILVTEDEVPSVPRFRCPPRDPPLLLLPERARRVTAPGPARLDVNPTFRYQDAAHPPEEGWAPLPRLGGTRVPGRVNPFAEGCGWAWSEPPDAPVPSVFSVDEPDRALFRLLRAGAPEPSGLDPALREALARADVLLDPRQASRRREAWLRARGEAGDKFRRDRHALLRGLIPPAMIAALRRYYRELVAEGHVRFQDQQVRLRYWAINEPLARFVHQRLAHLASDVAGEPLQPSFVYFASYRPGAEVTPHRDRDACVISISLLLDYEPEPGERSPWPLWVGLDDAEDGGRGAALELGLGDGAFYRGTQVTHWRDILPEGHASTSLFLNYVPLDFAGRLD